MSGYDFMRDGKTGQEQRSMVTRQIKGLLDKMGKNLTTSGDLKHINISITDSGPVLTDLDAMKSYRWNWTYQINRRKDLGRFTKNV